MHTRQPKFLPPPWGTGYITDYTYGYTQSNRAENRAYTHVYNAQWFSLTLPWHYIVSNWCLCVGERNSQCDLSRLTISPRYVCAARDSLVVVCTLCTFGCRALCCYCCWCCRSFFIWWMAHKRSSKIWMDGEYAIRAYNDMTFVMPMSTFYICVKWPCGSFIVCVQCMCFVLTPKWIE